MNRRGFLGGSLAACAAGANDRIGIGMIGCGGRGLLKEVLQFAAESNVEVTAICDTWRRQREAAAASVKQASGREPRSFVHYQELLALKEVDAVVIGTPDHQHSTQLTAAVRAGKDVYVEKPLAMDMKELVEAVDTVKRSDRVVQMGTQVRSSPNVVAARAFVAAGGLGKILKVDQSRNLYRPYWHSFGQRKVEEADVDWKAFLMHRKYRPFNADQYAAWYGYREFSRGPHANLAVHFFDLVHFITGAQLPRRVAALGGIYRWKDSRTCPDSVECTLEYPEGFLVRYSTVFGTNAGTHLKFFGTRGVMDCGPAAGRNTTVRPEPFELSGAGSQEPDRIAEGTRIGEAPSTHHMKNWLDCLRSRQAPMAPIDAGYAHSVTVIMADEALLRGARMIYDPKKREIREG